MRKFVIILAIIFTSACVYAGTNLKNNMPEGTFKKKSNGEYIQYNSSGKKIGVYKIIRGKFVRIK